MLDKDKTLFYIASGRAAKITESVPVRRYHVEFSNGATAWMTEEEMEQKFTNEPPRYTFAANYAQGHMLVEGREREVLVRLRRKFGDFPGQCLSHADVVALADSLNRWLADR
jgi:hypothetical protein